MEQTIGAFLVGGLPVLPLLVVVPVPRTRCCRTSDTSCCSRRSAARSPTSLLPARRRGRRHDRGERRVPRHRHRRRRSSSGARRTAGCSAASSVGCSMVLGVPCTPQPRDPALTGEGGAVISAPRCRGGGGPRRHPPRWCSRLVRPACCSCSRSGQFFSSWCVEQDAGARPGVPVVGLLAALPVVDPREPAVGVPPARAADGRALLLLFLGLVAVRRRARRAQARPACATEVWSPRTSTPRSAASSTAGSTSAARDLGQL